MAKLIGLFFICLICSCATGPKTKVDMKVDARDKLFATQNQIESYKSLKDPLFAGYKQTACLDNWQEEVFQLNNKLRKLKKPSQRVAIWFKLGNCYNYIEDYKKALYFYDLLLSVEKRNDPMLTKIMLNIGLIYEQKGLNVLARSYYQQSLNFSRNNHLARFMIAVDDLNQGNFKESEKNLNMILSKIPKSRVVRSVLGVNYVLSENKFALKNKVFKFYNEKDEERVLFNIALDFLDGKVSKERYTDLSQLEVNKPILGSFRKFLLTKFGKENE